MGCIMYLCIKYGQNETQANSIRKGELDNGSLHEGIF